jgi:hypothetical protein
MVQKFEVLFDIFNVIRICDNGNYANILIIQLKNHKLIILPCVDVDVETRKKVSIIHSSDNFLLKKSTGTK